MTSRRKCGAGLWDWEAEDGSTRGSASSVIVQVREDKQVRRGKFPKDSPVCVYMSQYIYGPMSWLWSSVHVSSNYPGTFGLFKARRGAVFLPLQSLK